MLRHILKVFNFPPFMRNTLPRQNIGKLWKYSFLWEFDRDKVGYIPKKSIFGIWNLNYLLKHDALKK